LGPAAAECRLAILVTTLSVVALDFFTLRRGLSNGSQRRQGGKGEDDRDRALQELLPM